MLSTFRYMCARWRHFLLPPRYPRTNKRLIHLGCGSIDARGYINVDIRRRPHIHHVHDVTKLEMFSDGFADLIYACHVLEHLSFRELLTVLKEWRRVLKCGGILRVSVPDFDRILNIYADYRTIDAVIPMLLGNQDYEFNYHKSIFNAAYLERLLKQAGFREVRMWQPGQVEHYDFVDWASQEIEFGDKSYPISLNVEAIK